MANQHTIDVEARRAQVPGLLQAGLTVEDIAARFGVTTRAIQRDRHELGLSRSLHHNWTEDELRLAKNLLEDGCPYAEVGRTIGLHATSIAHKFPGYGHQPAIFGNGRAHQLAEKLGLRLLP